MLLHWFRYTEFSLFLFHIALGLVWHFDPFRLDKLLGSRILAAAASSSSPTASSLLAALAPYARHAIYLLAFVALSHLWAQGPLSRAAKLAKKTAKLPLAKRPFFGTSAVVTGSNCGIGKETAAVLAALGFRVVMVCRSAEKTAKARSDILAKDPGADIRVVLGDLAELGAMRLLAERVARVAKEGGCFFSLLVQNAGLFAPTKTIKNGFDVCVLTNHLGPYLFVELLRPHMEKRITGVLSDSARNSEEVLAEQKRASDGSSVSSQQQQQRGSTTAGGNNSNNDDSSNSINDSWQSPRIVLVSSVAHLWATRPRASAPLTACYDSKTPAEQTEFWRALESNSSAASGNLYGISKACNAVHARLIQREEDIASKIHKMPNPAVAVSVHPGFVASDIWRWMPSWMSAAWSGLCFLTAKSCASGAQATLSCCIDPVVGLQPAHAVVPGGFHADCRAFPASSAVRDDAEVRAVAAWTKKTLEKYL